MKVSTRVISLNFIKDQIETIRNFFGMRLKGFEGATNKALFDIEKELGSSPDLIAISQLQSGALCVVGVKKNDRSK